MNHHLCSIYSFHQITALSQSPMVSMLSKVEIYYLHASQGYLCMKISMNNHLFSIYSVSYFTALSQSPVVSVLSEVGIYYLGANQGISA